MMTYAGIQMFKEKLKQLIINCNHIPSINHPDIIHERPQLQLLYDELHNPIIQTLFIHQHQHLEKINDLKKRFTDAAEEAEYIVDLFLSAVNIGNNGWRSFKSVFIMFLSYFLFESGVYIRNDGWRSFKSVFNLFLSYFLFVSGVHIRNNGWRSFKSLFNMFLSYVQFVSVVYIMNNGWILFKSFFILFLSYFLFESGVHIRHNGWRSLIEIFFDLFLSYFSFESGVHIRYNGWRRPFNSVFNMFLSFFQFVSFVHFVSGVYIMNNGWILFKSLFILFLSYFLYGIGDHIIHNAWRSSESFFSLFLSFVQFVSGAFIMNNGWILFSSLFILFLSYFFHGISDHIMYNAWRSSESFFDLFLSFIRFVSSVYIMNNGWRLFKSLFILFLSYVHIRNNGWRLLKFVFNLFLSYALFRSPSHSSTCEYFNRSLNLDDVMRSFESVKVELMSMRTDNIKMASSPTTDTNPTQSASFTRNSKGSMDEIMVGLDADLELIRDKLVEDQKKLDVVSIVGMGGIGKTTLATKVFNDPFVMYHFHVRIWVTVSQKYDKRNVLIQIMESIRGQLHLQKDISESELREMVHKNLMGKRYLIVIDDIWHTDTWDKVKVFFPHDNNGSRILLTSRLIEVAKHANSDGLIHQLAYLSKQKSWDLLCRKVFSGNECPKWSIEPGMQIVENCHGLPLALLAVAGVLAKKGPSKKFWVKIAKRTGSYIVGDQSGCMETLAFSYNHLPLHLRQCFLFLGGFPEDHRFDAQRLIWLWMAEGFIQEDGNRSLEDIAAGYLMDLIDRNLVIIAAREKCNGHVRSCKLHDIVRELCLKKAKEEQFILQTERLVLSSQSSNAITPPYKPVRMFVYETIDHRHFAQLHSGKLRSLLCFGYFGYLSFAKHIHSVVLLRVLDLQEYRFGHFPKGMELLVHLRYLAISTLSNDFPSSICNLWNLQTLICKSCFRVIDSPSNILELVNLRSLRHLHCDFARKPFLLPSIEKPLNLQTISFVDLRDGLDKFQKGFPYIKELECQVDAGEEYDFESLTCLEELTVFGTINFFTFPATLKTLTLRSCRLRWSDMSIIQLLPNIQVLKLYYMAFEGSCWNTDEEEFPQLKFLRLDGLDIKQWEAYSISFPCLIQLEILYCYHLEEIPLEIGDIPTLELINIKGCRPSLGDSVRRIQEEQNDWGNYNLKVDISDERV